MHPAAKPRPWDIHPVWRGIGCLLIILLPILAYAGAVLLVRENLQRRWVVIPPELVGSFVIPYLGRVFFADLAMAFVLLILGFAFLTVVYAFIYRLFGPPRYGPLDAPPPRRPKNRK
jgi:hypothetical protein